MCFIIMIIHVHCVWGVGICGHRHCSSSTQPWPNPPDTTLDANKNFSLATTAQKYFQPLGKVLIRNHRSNQKSWSNHAQPMIAVSNFSNQMLYATEKLLRVQMMGHLLVWNTHLRRLFTYKTRYHNPKATMDVCCLNINYTDMVVINWKISPKNCKAVHF